MNISTNSQFRNMAPPGTKNLAPEAKDEQEVQGALEAPHDTLEPEPSGHTTFQKVVTAVMASLAGLSAVSTGASAAPAEQLVTESTSQTDGLEITVLPPDSARVDILRNSRQVARGRSGQTTEARTPYSDVGVHLGGGIVHDTNGNLVVIPSLAAEWGESITEFKRVELDVPGFDESVTRYGNTVHHEESPFTRNVYVQLGQSTKLLKDGSSSDYQILSNGVQYRGEKGVEWRLTQTGSVVTVDGPGNQDFQITYGSQKHFDNIKVEGQKRHNEIYYNSNVIEVEGSGGEKTIVRDQQTGETKIDGGFLNSYTLLKKGDKVTVKGLIFDSEVTVNPSEFMKNQEIEFHRLTDAIEQAEPGYSKKHPLVMSVLEYAVANPAIMGEDADSTEVVGLGKAVVGTGAVLTTGKALLTGAKALKMGETAMELGARALEAKAAAQAAAQAAQAAAQAGNLAEAASLAAAAGESAQTAQTLGGQARSLGASAHELGDKALGTAKVAKIMTGVTGGLEIAEGVMDLSHGASDQSVVEGAMIIADAMLARLSEEQTGAELQQTIKDHADVMKVLKQLEANSEKTMQVGGMKIGCGGLMILSALAGGAVIPPIIGAVGAVCTVGTAVYEHWDDITGFFSGEEQAAPGLHEILP